MCPVCQAIEPERPRFPSGQTTPLHASVLETADAASGRTTGYNLSVGDSFVGTIESGVDTDWIAFDAVAGKSYTVSMAAGTMADPYLAIYDPNGNFVTFNDDGKGLDAEIDFVAGQSGTFYIEASSYHYDSGETADTGSYTLSLVDTPPAAPLPVYDTDEIAAQLTDGFWTYFGGGPRRLDASVGDTVTVNIAGLTAEGQQLALWALEAWEVATGLTFVTTTGPATITVDDTFEGAFAGAVVFSGLIQSATINIGTDWLSTHGTSIDSYSFLTYVHEFGHVLGLGHGGNYNFTARYPKDASYANDSWQASVMSYFDQATNTAVSASFAYSVTPMVADMVAVQNLYGVPSGVRAGDDIYGYNTTETGYIAEVFAHVTGQASSANIGTDPMALTLFDGGGTDWLDLRTDTTNQVIDLRAESHSDVYGLIGALSIARGTVIENVRAGLGDDHVTGNAAANKMLGGAGNDTLSGLGGNDQLSGNGGGDTLSGGSGADRLSGNVGFDTLSGGRGHDMLFGGRGQDRLLGGKGNDTLQGDRGNDRLSGDRGADVLIGGTGNDLLTGGWGADTFVFAGEIDRDTVTDFTLGSDTLQLSAALWSGTLDAAGVLSAFATVTDGDTRIDFGGGNVILLEGIDDLALLESDIFLF